MTQAKKNGVGARTFHRRYAAYDACKKKRCANTYTRKRFLTWSRWLLFQHEPEASITASSLALTTHMNWYKA